MSPTNRAYNSRLFSFLNRQLIKLKDKSIKTWRGVKVTVTWSAQILLYPIYLCVQTGRLIERQINQRIKLIQLPSSSNHSKNQETQEKPAIEATLTIVESWVAQEIQAIAAEKETGKLLLVKSDNTLLDILDQQQQQKLNKIITENIANYWRQRQENKQIEIVKNYPNILAPITTDNSNVIPPIRLFWSVMQWIQYSPVAMSVNLFGEAYLESIPQEDWYTLQALHNLIAKAIDYFFSGNYNLENISGTKINQLKSSNRASISGVKQPFIIGRPSHFFSQTPKEIGPVKTETTVEITHWLTWEDLYKQEDIDTLENVSIHQEAINPPLEKTTATDYLETKAISLGYEQHPLEKILRWLDHLLEWVENICLNMWQFFWKKK